MRHARIRNFLVLPVLATMLTSSFPAKAAHSGGREPVCSRADVVFCEDWEDGNHDGWSWNNGWTCATTQGSGFNSANAFKSHTNTDECECGAPAVYSLSESVQDSSLYMRFYVKFSAGYKFLDFTKEKVNYFWSDYGSGQYWDMMLGIRSTDSSRTHGQFETDSGPGHAPTYVYNGSAPKVIDSDRWYCVEWRMKGNTPGAADGSFDVWLDGQSYMSYSNVNLKSAGTPLNRLPWLSSYYGGEPCGAHPPQDILYDQIVIARSRIGCDTGGATSDTQPAEPTNLHRTDTTP